MPVPIVKKRASDIVSKQYISDMLSRNGMSVRRVTNVRD